MNRSQSGPTAAAPGSREPRTFPCSNARSASLLAGLCLAIAVETIVVHLWLATRHPVAAWILSATSLLSLLWLVGDYRALGRGGVTLTDHALHVRVGWRATADIALLTVQSATHPTWRDIPESGKDKGYIDLMAPVDPNVLLTLTQRVSVRLMGSINKPATRVGLTLNSPDGFVAAMDEALKRRSTE